MGDVREKRTASRGWKRDERTRWKEEGECSVLSSNGWAGKGVYAVPPGLGIGTARRTREEGIRTRCISFLCLSLSFSSFSSSSPLPPLPSSVLPVLSLFPTPFLLPPFRRDRPTFSRLDFAATLPVLFRIAALRLVESEDSQRPIEITRPVVFGLRAYRMVQRPPKAVEHS